MECQSSPQNVRFEPGPEKLKKTKKKLAEWWQQTSIVQSRSTAVVDPHQKGKYTMSAENVRAFFTKMEKDETLLAKVGSLHKEAQVDMDAAVAGLVKIASEAGFVFTPSEYAAARTHGQEDSEPSAEVVGQQAGLGGCNSNWSCARVKTM